MKSIWVFIVDDHPMMREALITAIEDEPDLEVVGDVSSGEEMVALAKELKPDVILMDLLMPGMDGLEAISRIFGINPQARILVLTSLEDEDKVLEAIRAGALGYLPKTAPRTRLLQGIRSVAAGDPFLPPEITLKLFAGVRKTSSTMSGTPKETLTPRQLEVLTLLGEGRSDAEIAAALYLQEATVRSHIHHILQRLALENRSQAVAYANRRSK